MMVVRIGVIATKLDGRTTKLKEMLATVSRKLGQPCTVKLLNFHSVIPSLWIKREGTKATYHVPTPARDMFLNMWDTATQDIDVVIAIDMASMHCIMPKVAATATSQTTTAGTATFHNGTPILWTDDVANTYLGYLKPEDKAAAKFRLSMHVARAFNLATKGSHYNQDTLNWGIVRSIADMQALVAMGKTSLLIAYDIETAGPLITCIGFTFVSPSLKTFTAVVPLATSSEVDNGQYWIDPNVHEVIWRLVKDLLEDPAAVKVAHNGAYDNFHLIRQHVCVANNIFDTQHALHSMWATHRKSLNIGASLFNSNYVYWKDDAKEIDAKGKKIHGMPSSPDMLFVYWRYNAMDCHQTAWMAVNILLMWAELNKDTMAQEAEIAEYAPHNMVREILIQQGPCMYMSLTGFKLDAERQWIAREQLQRQSNDELTKLRVMVDDPQFNPNSNPELIKLFYDTLGLKPVGRRGRSVGEVVLKNFSERHPMIARLVQSIWDVKKPRNNASKYGKPNLGFRGRFIYTLKLGTTTGRLSSSSSNLFTGTNAQNIGKNQRPMCRAEKGHVIVSADLSQADSYYVAFESQDPKMIATVLSPQNTHMLHIEELFLVPYDECVEGKAAKDACMVDPKEGLYPIIKRVVHGTNYGMHGPTMLEHMGRSAVIAAAKRLMQTERALTLIRFIKRDAADGADPASWSSKNLQDVCDFLRMTYYKRYPRTYAWTTEITKEAAARNNRATAFGGLVVKTLAPATTVPRFYSAFYGQGGTAGNISRAMLRLYFLAPHLWKAGYFMTLQIHDEIVSQIPEDQLWMADEIKKYMEQPSVIHGREFTVPVGVEMSRSWSKNGVEWTGKDGTPMHNRKEFPSYIAAIDAQEADIAAHFKLG